MDRRQPTFTLKALLNMVAAGRARNATFSELALMPRQYQELQDDIRQQLGLELPDVDSDLPVIVGGVQLAVWRPDPNVQPAEPTRRHPHPIR